MAQERFYQVKPEKPYYQLAGGRFDFLDNIHIVENGGKAGKGYLYAERAVDSNDWFFPFHFYQDPVMPGSLGVESIMQALQIYVLYLNLGGVFQSPQFIQNIGTIEWKYRGQLTPANRQMSLDIHITKIEQQMDKITVIGDANLYKDGLRIYEVHNVALCLVESKYGVIATNDFSVT